MAEKIGNVWVFIEQEEGKIAGVSLELVSKGRELADRLGVKLEAVLLGNGVKACCDTLIRYGCDKVLLAEDPRLEPFTVLPYAKVLMDLIRERKPNILLFGATLKGRELAPRVASEKLAGLTADCTDLRIDDFVDPKTKNACINTKQKSAGLRFHARTFPLSLYPYACLPHAASRYSSMRNSESKNPEAMN